jgi:hypothetical protein
VPALLKNLEGLKVHSLVFLGRGDKTPAGQYRWKVRCDCGREKAVIPRAVFVGSIKTCGQCQRFRYRLRHGHTRKNEKPSSTFTSWANTIQRCTNPNHPNYQYYGGSGVNVCDRWLTFENFLADMGERPEGTSLGRILDMGDYEPGNAFWQTSKEQALARRNRRALSSLGGVAA